LKPALWELAHAAQIITDSSNTEFAEFGEFINQKLFTPRPEPALSRVEGRLGGAMSEPCFTGKPEEPFIS